MTRVRLLPFVFSEDQAYVLEWTFGRVRFYANTQQLQTGGAPVQVLHPYTPRTSANSRRCRARTCC